MTAAQGATPVRAGLMEDLKALGHRILAGALGGFACGFVIGGIGGRLAMLILRLTTGTEVAGVESDDGFIMGSFTSATMFLVGITSFGGAFIGVIYSFVREWLPERTRRVATATLLGLVGGAAIIRPGGVDFTELRPVGLAIALFILLPALFGYALSATVDRLLKRPPGRFTPWLGLVAGLFVLLATGISGARDGLVLQVLALLLFVAAVIASRKFPWIRSLPSTPAVVWAARAVLVAGAGFGAYMLTNDIVQIV